ncbi:MetQ/NlpA family ABC transporter substrate-binding protein [Caviibacter abscessus]|uniref:MetQ/NlpA family ABC transporter substrate-binding protein n=1 Tax=Caviibacter abscessus TaxID=1766719 RepID=UPI000B3260BC|nr:MetQ/NlpA family ABC transporter substrate-binding protein [Caviibacter abscessus]
MIKKIMTLLFSALLFISCTIENDKTIKIATSVYPMEEIVKIASKDLEKKGYKVEIKVLTDYVTANVGLNAKEFDANFHQHEPFMNIFNAKNNGNLVKIKAIYDVYVGFYSKKYKAVNELPEKAKIAIPSDPTNQDRALRILAEEKLISLKEKDGLYKVSDIESSVKNFEFLEIKIPALVQAYQEADLVFNWPSHMLKIGVSPKDALFLEKSNNNKYAIILAARNDNKNSKKIKDIEKAMASEAVKEFLKEKYSNEGYPVF